MADTWFERPCIHVTLLPGVDPHLYHWVEIGAEEEGVPCRQVESLDKEILAEAYEAAQSSRFQVGVAVSERAVVLHEMHMPPHQAVLTFTLDGNSEHACRVMGANAARMVIHKPLHVDLTLPVVPPLPERKAPSRVNTPASVTTAPKVEEMPAEPTGLQAGEIEFLTRLITIVIQKLQERGIS